MSDTWPAPEDDVPLIGEVPALPEGALNKIIWNAHPALAPLIDDLRFYGRTDTSLRIGEHEE